MSKESMTTVFQETPKNADSGIVEIHGCFHSYAESHAGMCASYAHELLNKRRRLQKLFYDPTKINLQSVI